MASKPANNFLKTGTIVRLLGTYGFISCPDLPDQDVYFKTAWYQGEGALQEGNDVVFSVRQYDSGPQAHYLSLAGETRESQAPARRPDGKPANERLLDWAYLGYLPNMLAELKGLALPEDWEFKNTAPNTERPAPILYSYLFQTYGKLVLEDKVLVNLSAGIAAFNTGLVDSRYEPIYAVLASQDDPRRQWQLSGFCIAGEGADGQNLVRHFSPLPEAAHYFGDPVELLYDTRRGKPELDWDHVVVERIQRYPHEFVKDHWPTGFAERDASSLSHEEASNYYLSLGAAIKADPRTYRRIMNRVKDAIDLTVKRVAWNFKTAIPTYYPRVRKMQLLLPLCLLSDDKVDLALAVEQTPSGSYLGHTVLPLDWAYKNARLICRPDSDWLVPKAITSDSSDEL